MRELSLGGLLRACRNHSILFALCIVCGLGVTLGIIRGLHPHYTAESTLVLKTRVQHFSDIRSVTPELVNAQQDLAIARTETAVLQNPQMAREVITQLDLNTLPEFHAHLGLMSRLMALLAPALQRPAHTEGPQDALAAAMERYHRGLGVFNDGRSYVFTVSFEADDPVLAAAIVNKHVQLYLAQQREEKQAALQNAAAWVSREVDRLRGEVEASEEKVHAFRLQAGLLTSRGSTAVQQQVADISSQLAQAKTELAGRQAHMSEAKTATTHGSTGDQSRAIDDPLVQRMRERDADAHATLQSLLQKNGPDHPLVTQARAQVAELDARIAQELSRVAQSTGSDMRIASDRVTELSATLARLQDQRANEDAAASQLNQLERDLDATRSVYQSLRGRQAEIEAQRGSETADSQLIAAATAPNQPSFPNVPLLLALGLVASTGMGGALAWWRDQPGAGLDEPLQLEAASGLTVLQSIPRALGKPQQLAAKVISEPRSQFADSIRALSSTVARSMAGDVSARTLAVTSAAVGEGKTTLAVALARSMTTSGLRVLLIDCDLRRPRVAVTLGVSSSGQGLIAALQDRCTLEQAVRNDPISPLQVLCPEQVVERPQDMLGSGFADLLKQAQAIYDTIVIDTAPIGFISDAALVAQKADRVLVVVRWRRTTLPLVSMAIRALERCEASVCGCVLNAVDEKVLARTNPYLAELQRIKRNYFSKV